MSSRTYSSELTPDPVLRGLLLVAAAMTMLLGLLMILCLPIDRFLSVGAAIIWCAITAIEIAAISIAHKRFSGIRVYADGSIELRARDGVWQAATTARGCIVLPKLAWFRVRPAKGPIYRELVRGDSRESEQWRRLQVIWRHLGTVG